MKPELRTFNPTGTLNRSMIRGFMMLKPDEPPDHRGDSRQQFDEHLENLARPAGSELADEDGGAERERHGDHHRQTRDTRGTGDQRQGAVGRVVTRRRRPARRAEELCEAELIGNEAEPLLGDEDEDADDEQDAGDAADENQQLNRFVDVPVQIATIDRVAAAQEDPRH